MYMRFLNKKKKENSKKLVQNYIKSFFSLHLGIICLI